MHKRVAPFERRVQMGLQRHASCVQYSAQMGRQSEQSTCGQWSGILSAHDRQLSGNVHAEALQDQVKINEQMSKNTDTRYLRDT